MSEHGLLVNNEYGVDAQHVFIDNGVKGPAYFVYYDATNPEARRFVWDTIKRNYYSRVSSFSGWITMNRDVTLASGKPAFLFGETVSK